MHPGVHRFAPLTYPSADPNETRPHRRSMELGSSRERPLIVTFSLPKTTLTFQAVSIDDIERAQRLQTMFTASTVE